MNEPAFAVVVLVEGIELPARELAPPLARLRGRVRYDVAQALRANPLVPFADLAAPQAREAAGLLEGAGFRAMAVPSAELPPRPSLLDARTAEPRESDLLLGLADRVLAVRYDQIAALGAASFGRWVEAVDEGPSLGDTIMRAGAIVAWPTVVTDATPPSADTSAVHGTDHISPM